jgi:hypothetical protein
MGLLKREPMDRWCIWLSNGQEYTIVMRIDPNAAAHSWLTTEDGTLIRNDAIVAMKKLASGGT